MRQILNTLFHTCWWMLKIITDVTELLEERRSVHREIERIVSLRLIIFLLQSPCSWKKFSHYKTLLKYRSTLHVVYVNIMRTVRKRNEVKQGHRSRRKRKNSKLHFSFLKIAHKKQSMVVDKEHYTLLLSCFVHRRPKTYENVSRRGNKGALPVSLLSLLFLETVFLSTHAYNDFQLCLRWRWHQARANFLFVPLTSLCSASACFFLELLLLLLNSFSEVNLLRSTWGVCFCWCFQFTKVHLESWLYIKYTQGLARL